MDDDIPAWLPVPYPHDPEMQRHERSWTLMAGSRRLSFTRVDHYAVSRPRSAGIGTAPVRRWSLTGAVAVVLGSVAGVATLGLAMNASRAATGHYLVSIAVPDRIPFRVDRHSQAGTAGTVARRPAVAKPVAPAPAPMVAMAVPIDDGILPATAQAPLRLESMQPAIAAALRTGTMQQWTSTDGAERGFVVAGPADRGCRTLSILTRRDGDSEVRTQRECTAATDDGTATP